MTGNIIFDMLQQCKLVPCAMTFQIHKFDDNGVIKKYNDLISIYRLISGSNDPKSKKSKTARLREPMSSIVI